MAPKPHPTGRGQFGPDVYAQWRASSLGDITEALEHALILRMAGDVAGRRVLDVGSGDGTLSRLMASQGARSAAGCDLDPRMVARAAAAAGRPAPVTGYAVARAEALPFADASFDLITCITVLTFVPDAAAAVRETARVLAPGGRLILGDLGKWSVWAARRRVRGWLGARLWQTARFRSAGELSSLVRSAGLEVRAVEGSIYYPPSEALARRMAPLDIRLGALTTLGAGFLAVCADKP
ncbi:MAG: class I SAM-dependent methyltransferase [Acetobacteraceae bacterium]